MPYGLTDGSQWNPWLNFPRNEPCPCKSGKKFKKCHLLTMSRAVYTPEEMKRRADAKALKDAEAKCDSTS